MRESQNIETVRHIYAALVRGDIPGMIECMDEAIVVLMPGSPAVPTAGVRRGVGEVERFLEEWRGQVEFSVFDTREFIAQGNRVVALIHYEGRYRPTGKPFSADSAALWTLGNGRAIRFQEFTDTEALAKAAEENNHHSCGAS
jgi:ketosteroid isomerase-like protein